MSTVQKMSAAEKKRVYKDVMKALKPLSEKYDLSIIRWALNKFVTDQREINKALKQKEEAEARLSELNAT